MVEWKRRKRERGRVVTQSTRTHSPLLPPPPSLSHSSTSFSLSVFPSIPSIIVISITSVSIQCILFPPLQRKRRMNRKVFLSSNIPISDYCPLFYYSLLSSLSSLTHLCLSYLCSISHIHVHFFRSIRSQMRVILQFEFKFNFGRVDLFSFLVFTSHGIVSSQWFPYTIT